MARPDPEVAADIADDVADRPAAELGRDLRRAGQMCKTRVGLGNARGGRRPGCRGSSPAAYRSRVDAGGGPEHPRFERVGELQAAGDAREDQREIGGAEAALGEGGVGGDAPADRGDEFAAVVDQLADQAEQTEATAGFGGQGWGFGRGGHERNKNTRGGGCQGKYSWPPHVFGPRSSLPPDRGRYHA